jgi:hypothetical protein
LVFVVVLAGLVGFAGARDRWRGRHDALRTLLPSVWNVRALAADSRSVWIAGDTKRAEGEGLRRVVHRLDPRNGHVLAEVDVDATDLGFAGGRLWAWNGNDLVGIDSRSNAVVSRIRLRQPQVTDYDGFEPGPMLATNNAVWIGSGNSLLRLSPVTGQLERRVGLDANPVSLVEDHDGNVWAGLGGEFSVDTNEIDVRTNRVARRFACSCWVLGPTSDGRLWAATRSGVGVLPLRPRRETTVDVDVVARRETAGLDLTLADGALWWADEHTVKHRRVATLPGTRTLTPDASVRPTHIGRLFAVHDGSAWFTDWRTDRGFRLHRWTP